MYLAVDSNGYKVYVNKENIAKHSKNIIDLIEVGDIVNNYLVNDVGKDYVFCAEYEIEFQEDIETILTHEQYNQNCFKVKGE